ncbi:hypothetical protein I7I50_01436 [Histoplasma capsulatum G186AR]|uniref:Uncharacterized protein n=1 Tax=Ajellomyces capsulatus TaxID=5037 RepID=A0A8H7YAM5_AJECA|nr:hypothetical protein I7I52_12552 [Histoplasma capsulatum]QSS73314.1 hypothetical protein I7I50_01436 [Histoplasma capsulatum G186AR]
MMIILDRLYKTRSSVFFFFQIKKPFLYSDSMRSSIMHGSTFQALSILRLRSRRTGPWAEGP